jgi:fibronectin type 3 domain-containing protein
VFRDGAKVGEGQKGEFLDRTAGVGKAYKYSIEALGEKARGRRSDEVELIVADRFPPTIPSGVNAVAGAGTIELSWNTNTEPDLAGYQLERREGDSEWTVAAASVDVPGYSDRAVVSGRRYRYRVSALDGRGNRSVPSQVVEITAP